MSIDLLADATSDGATCCDSSALVATRATTTCRPHTARARPLQGSADRHPCHARQTPSSARPAASRLSPLEIWPRLSIEPSRCCSPISSGPNSRQSSAQAPRVPKSKGSRYIPSAVRRAVWKRDGGRCAFVGAEGRCTERGFLEFHHVEPHAVGGAVIVENLELRCRAHNLHEAEHYFSGRLPLLREARAGTTTLLVGPDRRRALGRRVLALRAVRGVPSPSMLLRLEQSCAPGCTAAAASLAATALPIHSGRRR